VLDIAASKTKVISNWELRGTMIKSVFGMKPTNREINVFDYTLSIFRRNKMVSTKLSLAGSGFFNK